MPEADKEGHRYQADTPQAAPGFFLKGSHQLDWGMKNRLARTFSPATGRTVMLAVDHGYIQGRPPGSSASISISCRCCRNATRCSARAASCAR
jgi:putative autoinducer-2 (AI-2) aldolase